MALAIRVFDRQELRFTAEAPGPVEVGRDRGGEPLGYRVLLTRDRWREIVRFKHPVMAGHEAAVRDCVRDPDFVRASARDPDVHLFYRSSGGTTVCVVVGGDPPADSSCRSI